VVSGGHDVLFEKAERGHVGFIVEILKGQDQHAGADVARKRCAAIDTAFVARRNHPLIARRSVMLEEYANMIGYCRSTDRRAASPLTTYSPTAPRRARASKPSPCRPSGWHARERYVGDIELTEMLCEQRIGALAAVPFEVPGDGTVIGITMRKDWKPNEIQGAFIDSLKRGALQLDNGGRLRAATSTSQATESWR